MSNIEWTDETWNPVIGCRRVSEGCRNCYAETQARRIVAMQRGLGNVSPYEDVVKMTNCETCDSGYHADVRFPDRPCPACRGAGNLPLPLWNGKAVFLPEVLDKPLRWTKPRMVFVNSMSDLFHEDLEFEQIAAVFGVMAASPQHTFQVLTKRPGRALEFFDWLTAHAWSIPNGTMGGDIDPDRTAVAYARNHVDRNIVAPHKWPLPNVWLGVSAENQATAYERIPLLLQCPAAVRFVSAEPLLGPIDFSAVTDPNFEPIGHLLDWIIVGGESGPGARHCDVAWIRSIIEQCADARVACFVKQLGAEPVDSDSTVDLGMGPQPGWSKEIQFHIKDRKGGDISEWPEDLCVRQFPGAER